MANLADSYPSTWHLAARAKRRMPFFAWEYLDSGTGMERLVDRNRAALDAVRIVPRVMQGRYTPDVATRLMGRDYAVPFGIAPVGMSGLMWPGAENMLARAAQAHSLPFGLSMVANETPEMVAGHAPDMTWMQIYPPREADVLDDLLARVRAAGIDTIIVTVDVPVGSRRERQLAAGLTVPPRMTPRTLWRVAKRPHWALATLRYGQPRFRTLERYFPAASMKEAAKLIGTIVDGRPNWDDLDRIRAGWEGKLVVKGVLHPADAEKVIAHGADAIWVSNHGGRQFDGAPAAIDALPGVVKTVSGRVPVLFDSGIRGGLDILRALALGADFCFLGRAFLYAVAALGDRGADHVCTILRQDLENNMIQIGARSIADIGGRAIIDE